MWRIFHLAFGVLIISATFGVALVAVGALFGFIHPSLDFFNHLQPILFSASVIALFFSAIFIAKGFWRSLSIIIATLGFLSSSFIVIPDAIASFTKQYSPLPINDSATYKLLTHNLFGKNQDSDRVVRAIKKQDPDIVAFQEYFFFQRQEIHPMMVEHYPFFEICKGGKRNNIAIYSKIKFTLDNKSSCYIGQNGRISRLIANFNTQDKKPFSIITTHLDWPAQVRKINDGDDFLENLNLVFTRKREQFFDLGKTLNEISNPLILAGDLNSTSWSYALRNFTLKNNLTLQTRGLLTYPNRLYIFAWRDTPPFLSLDHVLTNSKINIHQLERGDPAGSDHNSIVTVFSVANGE